MEEIEFVTLPCGHSVNQHIPLGICSKCAKRSCAKCLQPLENCLLCPDCFVKRVFRGDCCG
ncbi:MAG: hypothetical protein ACRD38_04930 [Nitrososphaerales archaeon]